MKDKFWNMNRKEVENLKRTQYIIMGDFNSTSSILRNKKPLYFRGQYLEDMKNIENGNRLIRFCTQTQNCISKSHLLKYNFVVLK